MEALYELQILEKAIAHTLRDPTSFSADYMTTISTRMLINILIELKLLSKKLDKINGN